MRKRYTAKKIFINNIYWMIRSFTFLILFGFLLTSLTFQRVGTTHVVGGDISYTCINRFDLYLYRKLLLCEVIGIFGKKYEKGIITLDKGKQKILVDLNGLAKGLYFLRIYSYNSNSLTYKKFVVE